MVLVAKAAFVNVTTAARANAIVNRVLVSPSINRSMAYFYDPLCL